MTLRSNLDALDCRLCLKSNAETVDFDIILSPSRETSDEPGQVGNQAALNRLPLCGGFFYY